MPRVTISYVPGAGGTDAEFLSLDLPLGLTIADLKGLVEAEANLPPSAQQYYFNGNPVAGDEKTLEEIGVKDGDMMAIVNASEAGRSGSANQASSSGQSDQIEMTRQRLLNDAPALAELREKMPSIANAVSDPAQFRRAWLEAAQRQNENAHERQRLIAEMNNDPFNEDTQRRIEEMIREDNVNENIQYAYEHNPEVFARVTMLYINVEVNGHRVKAFVDSGAQATIMSPSCAETCGIMRLIDKRFAGMAKGVGTAKILGRVHSAVLKIGDANLPCSFTVMEGKDVDLLLGLDMLKRYQATIDLRANKLSFQGTEVEFLPESEIPKQLEEAMLQEPTIAGPPGTEIGARSGVVRPAGEGSSASTILQGPSTSTAGQTSARTNTARQAGTSASTTATARPSNPPANRPAQANRYAPEASIAQLESIGFTRDEAIAALNATNGDVEMAASFLFQN